MSNAVMRQRRGTMRLVRHAPTQPSLLRARHFQRYWRFNAVGRSETALVDGQAQPSPRIDVKQRLLQRHIAERADKGQVERGCAEDNVNRVAVLIAELQEIFGIDVGDQVAEWAIRGDHFAM